MSEPNKRLRANDNGKGVQDKQPDLRCRVKPPTKVVDGKVYELVKTEAGWTWREEDHSKSYEFVKVAAGYTWREQKK